MSQLVCSAPESAFIKCLGPEVEARISAFRSEHGPVLFGGRLRSQTDPGLALPDNMGGYLEDDAARTSATTPIVS